MARTPDQILADMIGEQALRMAVMQLRIEQQADEIKGLTAALEAAKTASEKGVIPDKISK